MSYNNNNNNNPAVAATVTNITSLSKSQLSELEALGSFASNLHQLNATLTKIVTQVDDIQTEMRAAERKLGALHTPFQSSVYEVEAKGILNN